MNCCGTVYTRMELTSWLLGLIRSQDKVNVSQVDFSQDLFWLYPNMGDEYVVDFGSSIQIILFSR